MSAPFPPAHDNSATPPGQLRPRALWLFIGAVSFVLCDIAVIGLSRGRFRELFADLSITPSPITSFALGMILPISLVAMCLGTIVIEWLPLNPRVKNLVNALVVCLALVCLAVYITSVSSALMSLIHSLS